MQITPVCLWLFCLLSKRKLIHIYDNKSSAKSRSRISSIAFEIAKIFLKLFSIWGATKFDIEDLKSWCNILNIRKFSRQSSFQDIRVVLFSRLIWLPMQMRLNYIKIKYIYSRKFLFLRHVTAKIKGTQKFRFEFITENTLPSLSVVDYIAFTKIPI